MSYLSDLCAIYEDHLDLAGVERAGEPMLAPRYHLHQQAGIEICMTADGKYIPNRAVAFKKGDRAADTLIPVTEASGGRAGSMPAAHPLFDKLSYLCPGAGALMELEGDKTATAIRKFDKLHGWYLDGLRAFCASPLIDPLIAPALAAVRSYLEGGTIIDDLISDGFLGKDERGKIPNAWSGDDAPSFYGKRKDPLGALVRIRIIGDEPESRLWMRQELWNSFIAWQDALEDGSKGLCYVLGTELTPGRNAPKYIRYPGDGAKLLSSNDSRNFTYRGRFKDSDQAFCVSRKAMDQSHSALRWLIAKQGWKNRSTGQVVVAFGRGANDFPSIGAGVDELDEGWTVGSIPTTQEDYAKALTRLLRGRRAKLPEGCSARVLGLDSATEGRLSVFYDRQLPADELVSRVVNWQETVVWRHRYLFMKPPGEKAHRVPFFGTPSMDEIITALYGENAGDKLRKNVAARLLPCIVDSVPLPRDVVETALERATARLPLCGAESFACGRTNPNGNYFFCASGEMALTVACALIRKSLNDLSLRAGRGEVWKVEYDMQNKDRDYLFGRLLALAQKVELDARAGSGETRPTNAERLQIAFARHPARTWKILFHQLDPYRRSLVSRRGNVAPDDVSKEAKAVRGGVWLLGEINRVVAEIGETAPGFTDKPLGPNYLLGYSSSLNGFYTKTVKEDSDEVEDTKE